ncbi:hypothetical protein M3J09_002334 [Ascochyta lentis]
MSTTVSSMPANPRIKALSISSLVSNIAFLLRCTFDLDIELSAISIPIIDIREGHILKAKQATVVMHEGVGKFTVIVKAEVTCRKNAETYIMPVLTEKVDAIIKDILEKEGSGGCSV